MRQFVFGLVALLLVYGGWQFLRALRISFRQQTVSPDSKKTGAANLDDDLFSDGVVRAKEPKRGTTIAVYSHKRPSVVPAPEKAKETPLDSFSVELELQRLRFEINGLREKSEAQQQDIESLRTKMEARRKAQAEAQRKPPPEAVPLRPSSPIQDVDMSPEYDEALALARRGIGADVIASRCGITRAEADLVASLASRGQRREAAARGSL